LAVIALYININNAYGLSPLNGAVTLYTGLSSDELVSSTANQSLGQIYVNAVLPSNPDMSQYWQPMYTGIIYDTNACIAGISASKTLSISVKNQLTGEAEVIRALAYFNMVNLFGGVPLVVNTNYNANAILPKTSTDQVYTQIVADLTDAVSKLLTTYPSSGRVRPNKYTAEALLSRVYLYNQQWAKAETTATDIINSGIYSLETDLNNVFLAGSNEAIWQMLPNTAGYETTEGYTFVPTTTGVIPNYLISNYLLDAFETGDQRKIKWLNSDTVNNTPYYYPYKYKLGQDNNTTPVENYMMFRLGEQYLIRAEARAELKESNAVNDLNIIRNRAGLPNYSGATDENSLLAAILHERQIELFCEWGNRWYDLKRTGTVNAVMSVVTPTKGGNWNPNDQLYPVPINEIQANPFLVQNPGY